MISGRLMNKKMSELNAKDIYFSVKIRNCVFKMDIFHDYMVNITIESFAMRKEEGKRIERYKKFFKIHLSHIIQSSGDDIKRLHYTEPN